MSVPSLDFTFEFFKDEDGYYVACCKEIPGVASQGKTLQEAKENVLEALMAALETLAEESSTPRRPRSAGRRVTTSKVSLVPA